MINSKSKLSLFTFILVSIFSFCNISIQAQTLDDALRFSDLSIQGTASATSTGNAFNALGADFTASSMNPAGLAGFRNSYFVLTPAYVRSTTTASLKDGETKSKESSKLVFNNLGLVFASTNADSKWSQSNIAVGLNKLANFNEKFSFKGKTVGSITERFVGLANGHSVSELDGFEALPAWEEYAISPGEDSVSYVSDIQHLDSKIHKNQLVERTGSMNELTVGWGGKYNSNLDVGFSVGIPFISFEEVKYYEEEDLENEHSSFKHLKYKEYLSTSGIGLNLKAGVIYNVKKKLRFGLAVQSPTWIRLEDEYYTDLYYKSEFTSEEPYKSEIGNFKYKLSTPWTTTASIGSLFRSGEWKGFVNLDVDIKDYKNNSFNLLAFSKDEDADFRFEEKLNNEIDSQLGLAISYRIGGEIGYKKARLRLGFAAIGSPYKIDGQKKNKNIFSLGTGYRWNSVYLDIAYQFSEKEEGYTPYQLDHDNSRNQFVENVTKTGQTAITIGFNF